MGYYEQAPLEHLLSAALLHVCLLRERGDNAEADHIMSELLSAFDKANTANQEAP